MPGLLPLGVLLAQDAAGALARRLFMLAGLVLPALAGLCVWAVRARVVGPDTSLILFLAAALTVGLVSAWLSVAYVVRTERERLAASASIGQGKVQLTAILDTALDAVISMNARGTITYWNRPAETLFGWPADAVIGRDLADMIMPERFREPHRRGLERFLVTGIGPILGRRIETTGLRRDGVEFPIELSVVALASDGATTFNAFIADISERHEAAAAAQLRERHQSSLLRLSERLEQSSSVSAVLTAAVEELAEVLGYRSVWACLFSDDGESISLIGVEGKLAAQVTRDAPPFRVKGDAVLESLLMTQDIIVMKDAAADPRANPAIVAKYGVRTVVCAPMMLAERRIGILGTGTWGDEGVRPPAPAALDYFREMSNHVAVSLDRIRLLAERARAMEETRALNAELNDRVIERTRQLELANRELEAFSYSVSHDLRAPLRHVDEFSRILLEDHRAGLDASAERYLTLIRRSAGTMHRMIDDLLQLARVDRQSMSVRPTDLGEIVRDVVEGLRRDTGGRNVHWDLQPLPVVTCDPGLVKLIFTNLLSNAVKYTSQRADAWIRVSHTSDPVPVVIVEDNGAGFDQRFADRLFGVFQRLHRPEEFEGTGIGLATVQRIVHKHGGRVWAEAEPGKGARFFFTLAPS